MDMLLADLRFAARVMRRNQGFTLVVVLSLAVGIGATTAIFTIVNAVVLRPLPVPRPDEVRVVRQLGHQGPISRFSYPMFERFRAALPNPGGITAMSRVARMRMLSEGSAEPGIARVQLVSDQYFDVLGVRPALGRLLAPGDGDRAIGVISHALWQRQFAGSADVVGRSLTLNTGQVTIVGVAPEEFSGVWLESPVQVWVPLAMQPVVRYAQNYSASDSDPDKPWPSQEGITWVELVLRAERLDGPEAAALRGVFRQSQLKEAEGIADPQDRALHMQQQLVIEPFEQGFSTLRQQFGAPLLALMAMVSLLLLIACANTATLLLARAAARQREMAVRLSMGASRGRVIRQLLTESLLLGGIAGAVGLILAPWASEYLVRLTIDLASGPIPFSVGMDVRVLAFTIVVSALTGILFGLAPAWRTTDLEIAVSLKGSGSRGVHDGSRLNLGKCLVASQVALSLLLVVGAALFAQSFRNLLQVDLGFDAQNIVSLSFNPRAGDYPVSRMPEVHRRMIERAEAVPGVRSATVAMCGLIAGCRSRSDGIAIAGYQRKPGEQVLLQENLVGPRYFTTVGMHLVAGRDFDARDTATSPKVAIVNESMARRYFAGRTALGQRFGYDAPDVEIVGIVRDARVNAAREAPVPMAFYPLDQRAVYATTLDVRVAGEAGALAGTLQKAIAATEPGLLIERVSTGAAQARLGVSQERLVAGLTSLLGTLALGLACLGLYGLMSYAVKRRTAELGIRMALGAPQSRVLWMVFAESLALVSVGLAIGVPLVFAASRSVSALLFGVSADDPATILSAALALVAVAAMSGYLPAWRASRVDPIVALRTE